MKKIVLALAVAAILAGCQKPEVEGPVDSNDVFTASVEEFDAQTKTSMTENRRIVWSTGDRLSIFQGSTIADEYVLADGSAGLSSGSFKWVSKDNEVNSDFGAGFELPCNVAFYPYAEGLLLDGDMLEDDKQTYTISTVVLPEVQNYVENSFGNGAFPMVAVTANMSDHNLKFKNVLGAMKLQLKGNLVVKSIKVEGTNGEKLSGAATVTAYANNLTPAITMSADAAAEVTLDCGDGVQLSESEATNFYIALPPVKFQNGFTVTVTDVNNQTYTIKANTANTVLRSSILVMPTCIIGEEGSGAEIAPHGETMYITGAYNGWRPGQGLCLFNLNNTSRYSGMIDFDAFGQYDSASNEFKVTGTAWGDGDEYSSLGDIDEASQTPLVNGYGDNISVYTNHRYYQFTIDCSVPVLVKNFSFNQISVIGDFNKWSSDVVMQYHVATQKFYADVEFTTSGGIYFRADSAWDLHWGDAEGYLTANSQTTIAVQAGKYRIYLDMNNPDRMTYTFDSNAYGTDELPLNPVPEPEPEPEPQELDYVDEYGINHGPGVEIDGVVWAPVNCGYHAEDYKWGKLYQWGRKYGQGADGDATTPEFVEGSVSLEVGQSEVNKNVFFEGAEYQYTWLYGSTPILNWVYPAEEKLWNSGTEESPIKTEYDPCPNGWRVPTYAELNKLRQNYSSWTTNNLNQPGYWLSGASSYTEEAPQVFFPATGILGWNRTSVRGGYTYYFSSRFCEGAAYPLIFGDDDTPHTALVALIAGSAVRCVRDASSADTPEEDELVIPVESVSLNSTSLKLYEDDSAQLVAKVRPVDATYKSITWSSSDPSVASVDQNGVVRAISVGTAEISAQVGEFVATCSVEVMQTLEVTKDYIDEYGVNHGPGVAIGMAVWAPVNCGYHATDYQWGKLYQWGRKYGQGYNSSDATTPEFSEGGVSLQDGQSDDNKNVFFIESYDWLYSQNDALWNSGSEESPVKTEYDPCPTGWRVPTYAELEELRNNYSEWTINENSQPGCWFSGPSLYSSEVAQVFFPAAGSRSYYDSSAYGRGGSGYYWSSRPGGYYRACHLSFGDGDAYVILNYRAYGYSVRCVQD